MTREKVNNRDRLIKKSYPIQTYALSGHEASRVTGSNRNKNIVDGPPMIITPTPPGCFGYNDEAWSSTFGASMDSFLSLLPGDALDGGIFAASFNSSNIGPSFEGLPSAATLSLYEAVDDKQQISFIVYKNKLETAKAQSTIEKYEETRSLGIRGPIQMGGWGRTIGIRPTDPDPANKRENDNDHKLDASSWKFGPVDLRWDNKRKCWRGFNDLVVDQPDSWSGEGTIVFGTNPDTACGFPFLKGRLEQVWWVRKTADQGDTVGDSSDRSTSAEVLTTLSHKWFDSSNSCAGSMADIFLIHRDPTRPATCGTETTYISTIELYTSVYFHLSDKKDGPINFTANDPADNDIVGEMKFIDGVWSPTMQYDPCDPPAKLYFDRTFINDITLAHKICEVCDLVLQLHGFSKAKAQPGKLGGAAQKLDTAVESANDAANGFSGLPVGGNEALNDAQADAATAFNQLKTDLQNASAKMDLAKSATDSAADANEAANAAAADFSNKYDAHIDALNARQENPNSITRKAAEKAANEMTAARLAANEARRQAVKANEAAEKARADARTAKNLAKQSATDAAAAREDWRKEVAKDATDGEDRPTPQEADVDRRAGEAISEANDALGDSDNAINERQSAEDCCKVNKKSIQDLKAALGGDEEIEKFTKGGGPASKEDLDDAINESHKKVQEALNALTNAINDAIENAINGVNAELIELGGGIVDTSDTEPPTIGQDASEKGGDGDGGSSGGDRTGGDEEEGETGGEIPENPPGLSVPPEPPDCGVIDLIDPCQGKHKIISCRGGGAGKSTTGGGTGDQNTGPDGNTNPEGERVPRTPVPGEDFMPPPDSNSGLGLKEGGKAAGGTSGAVTRN